MSVPVAVRFGALIGLVQMAALLLTPGSRTVGTGVFWALLYVEAAAGPGVAYYWASGPRFSTAPSGSTGRRRLTGALVHAAGAGTGLFVLSLITVYMVHTVSGAPWPLSYGTWYLLLATMAARTAYRRSRSVAKSARKQRSEEPVRATAVRLPETEEEAPAALERVRAPGEFGPGAAERCRDPEQQARDAEQAITEFGALLSVHPFTPGDPGATYQHLADHSLALDAYERAKSAPAADVPGILAEGRAALERLDRRLGLDTAAPGVGCFFDQRHGPGVVSVRWAPPGGAVRIVEVCRADAVRLADGELPGGR